MIISSKKNTYIQIFFFTKKKTEVYTDSFIVKEIHVYIFILKIAIHTDFQDKRIHILFYSKAAACTDCFLNTTAVYPDCFMKKKPKKKKNSRRIFY